MLGGRRHFGETCRAVTADQFVLTAEFMDQLGSEDLATAATIADEFEVTVKALEQGCRARDLPSQMAATKIGSAQLTRYLAVASHNYKKYPRCIFGVSAAVLEMLRAT